MHFSNFSTTSRPGWAGCRLIAVDCITDEATLAELAAAKKRVAELETRIAALEAQAAAQSTARGALTDQLAELTTAQQVRGDHALQYCAACRLLQLYCVTSLAVAVILVG